MSELSELKPRERLRIIDLVSAAGVDVSDWGNFKRGGGNAASNPKYCYEWSLVEPNKVVVLNLWYASMQERDGLIYRDINFRDSARRQVQHPKTAIWEKRALKMDDAIRTASRQRLPIRVVAALWFCSRQR